MWFIPTIREKMREKGISLNDDHIFVFCKERGIEPKLKYGSDGKCLGYAITFQQLGEVRKSLPKL